MARGSTVESSAPLHHWVSYAVVFIYLLAIINALDLHLRSWLVYSDTPIALDREGLEILNEQANLGIGFIYDEDFEPQYHTFGELPDRSEEIARSLISDPHLYSEQLSAPVRLIAQSRTLMISDYLEARVLPALPYLNDRPQLGLFAKRAIPAGRALVWRSDYGVCRSGERSDLPQAERVNLRPLASLEGIEVFQSGGLSIRSNPITLANFSWCHTESIRAAQSPYRLLPPHDLGPPNSHFASVVLTVAEDESSGGRHNDSSGPPWGDQPVGLSSALITYRPIAAGDQLLAYSGEGANALIISVRRLTSRLLELLTPALIIAPWLRLFTKAL